MKEKVLLVFLLVISINVYSQNGFKCDLRDVDTVITSTEKCILQCIKDLPLEKYLGNKSIDFFDSLINCSYKEVGYLYENKNVVTTVAFAFTSNLQVRFNFKRFKYVKSSIPPGQLDVKSMRKEVPDRIRIFYGVTVICEMGSLKDHD